MTDDQTKQLCLELIKADAEESVIILLKEANLWAEQSFWRYYGDYENNYNTIGNQQGRADAALVEKIVNSVDARLMNECLWPVAINLQPNVARSLEEFRNTASKEYTTQ